MRTVLISYFIVIILASCQIADKPLADQEKETVLIANQKFTDLNKIHRIFKIYKDSSYIYTEIINELNHNKTESWRGKVQISNDTIKFLPFRLNYNRSETAILKNGFIEFIDGDYFHRMKIVRTNLKVKNLIDFKNFQDYSVFTFHKSANNLHSQKSFTNYDLTSNELNKIDILLKQVFSQNNKLRKFSDYIKQLEAVKNANNDKIIFIRCFCKGKSLQERYQYFLTTMHDGGNCNIYIELNLTTGKIEIMNIAGLA